MHCEFGIHYSMKKCTGQSNVLFKCICCAKETAKGGPVCARTMRCTNQFNRLNQIQKDSFADKYAELRIDHKDKITNRAYVELEIQKLHNGFRQKLHENKNVHPTNKLTLFHHRILLFLHFTKFSRELCQELWEQGFGFHNFEEHYFAVSSGSARVESDEPPTEPNEVFRNRLIAYFTAKQWNHSVCLRIWEEGCAFDSQSFIQHQSLIAATDFSCTSAPSNNNS